MCEIRHCVPNIGAVTIRLYEPADEVYRMLSDAGEVERLRQLRHIGALEIAYPGIAHSRWDYTFSMLYVIDRLKGLFGSATFNLGNNKKKFSSTAAALQCLALLSNIGHLPGTYAVEKGVTRFFLRGKGNGSLKSLLSDAPWRHGKPHRVIREADSHLRLYDYLSLNRLLGLIKLGTNFHGKHEVPSWLVDDLYAPFLLEELRPPNPRWSNIEEWFDTARRLAYLNHDTTVVEFPLTVDVSRLLSNVFQSEHLSETALNESREILAAYEHMVYERFYHEPAARKVTAVVASRIRELLEAEEDPAGKIVQWLYDSQLTELQENQELEQEVEQANLVASVSLRTLFPSLNHPWQIENEIVGKMSVVGIQENCIASVLEYQPCRLEHAIEPDHTYIDTYVLGRPQSKHVGRLICWIADSLDEVVERSDKKDDAKNHYRNDDRDDPVFWMTRDALEPVYRELIARLVEVAWPGHRISFVPWPLSRLGKWHFRGYERDNSDRIAIWLAGRTLDDEIAKHIVRRPNASTTGHGALAAELGGLRQLRTRLRRGFGSNYRPRRRYFLLTASIRLIKGESQGGQIEKEFDGGVLQVPATPGAAYLYVLETKGANTARAAVNKLREKINALQLRGEVAALPHRSAYARLSL